MNPNWIRSRTAREIYERGRDDAFIDGYKAGFVTGYRAAGEQADLAARRFIALEAAEAHIRTDMKHTRQMLDVPRYASKPAITSGNEKRIPTLTEFLAGLKRGGILRTNNNKEREAA